MNDPTQATERELGTDLTTLAARFADDESSGDLYRALANRRWRKRGHVAAVALSWSRAEALVNDVRAQSGRESLALAQTGDEGTVADTVAAALGELGWSSQPLDTSEHDDRHAGAPESPPPPDTGERRAPVSDSGEWERTAHEEAERSRLREAGAPPAAGPGEAPGGGEPPRVGGG